MSLFILQGNGKRIPPGTLIDEDFLKLHFPHAPPDARNEWMNAIKQQALYCLSDLEYISEQTWLDMRLPGLVRDKLQSLSGWTQTIRAKRSAAATSPQRSRPVSSQPHQHRSTSPQRSPKRSEKHDEKTSQKSSSSSSSSSDVRDKSKSSQKTPHKSSGSDHHHHHHHHHRSSSPSSALTDSKSRSAHSTSPQRSGSKSPRPSEGGESRSSSGSSVARASLTKTLKPPTSSPKPVNGKDLSDVTDSTALPPTPTELSSAAPLPPVPQPVLSPRVAPSSTAPTTTTTTAATTSATATPSTPARPELKPLRVRY